MTRVTANEAVSTLALRLLGGILEGAPQAVRETKRRQNQVLYPALEGELAGAEGAFLDQAASAEGREGRAAFAEKRKPTWE